MIMCVQLMARPGRSLTKAPITHNSRGSSRIAVSIHSSTTACSSPRLRAVIRWRLRRSGYRPGTRSAHVERGLRVEAEVGQAPIQTRSLRGDVESLAEKFLQHRKNSLSIGLRHDHASFYKGGRVHTDMLTHDMPMRTCGGTATGGSRFVACHGSAKFGRSPSRMPRMVP